MTELFAEYDRLFLIGGSVVLFLIIISIISIVVKSKMNKPVREIKKIKKVKQSKKNSERYTYKQLDKMLKNQFKRLIAQHYKCRRDIFFSLDNEDYSDYLIWGNNGIFYIRFIGKNIDAYIKDRFPIDCSALERMFKRAIPYMKLPYSIILVSNRKEPVVMKRFEEDRIVLLNSDDLADFILTRKQIVFSDPDLKLLKNKLIGKVSVKQ